MSATIEDAVGDALSETFGRVIVVGAAAINLFLRRLTYRQRRLLMYAMERAEHNRLIALKEDEARRSGPACDCGGACGA